MSWLNSKARRPGAPDDASAPREQATGADLILAYRLLLKREPDADGLASYSERLRQGLTVEELIQDLLASPERVERLKAGSAPSEKRTESAAVRRGDYIDPKDVIQRYSIEELNRNSDEYFQRLKHPELTLTKPFGNVVHAPAMLENLGALIGGLQLARAMTVLDFGAGTCWLSRLIAQLNCAVICCDPSAFALDLGRRFFEEHPPMGIEILPARFLLFDGHRIDLPDQSVDRIICFDAFHHVPNQAEVIREFGRVLRMGGMAGFSEPGRYHSHSPDAQTDMREFGVLENDINLNEIFALAEASGFTGLSVRVQNDLEISLEQYNALLDPADPNIELRTTAWGRMHDTMVNRSVFFLRKGETRLDSRSPVGLAHEMRVEQATVTGDAGWPITLTFTITNTGQAHWIDQAIEIYGVVRLACHLRANGRMIDAEYFRGGLPKAVAPGETIQMTVGVRAPDERPSEMVFDMVAEGVTWFEEKGSRPVIVTVV